MLRFTSRAPGPRYSEVAILQALKAATTPRERQRLQEELIRVGRWAKRIRALARRWQCETVELEEFESAGVMGLLEAASVQRCYAALRISIGRRPPRRWW